MSDTPKKTGESLIDQNIQVVSHGTKLVTATIEGTAQTAGNMAKDGIQGSVSTVGNVTKEALSLEGADNPALFFSRLAGKLFQGAADTAGQMAGTGISGIASTAANVGSEVLTKAPGDTPPGKPSNGHDGPAFS